MIEGGYYLKARSIQKSEIMKSPPHVREVWDWLLLNASHKDGNKIKRGQVITTYEGIREGLAWYIGWRKQTYSIHQIKQAMITLKTARMITTTKSTRRTIVEIVNYSLYQDPKNYTNTINKNQRPLQRTTHVDRYDRQEGIKNNKYKGNSSNQIGVRPVQEINLDDENSVRGLDSPTKDKIKTLLKQGKSLKQIKDELRT